MKEEIKVPPMGESITEATIGTLIKKSGSAVQADDEILELETDKVNQVLYAKAAGVLTLQVKADDVVKIGQVIGFIDTEAKSKEAPPVEKPPAQPPAAKPVEKPAPVLSEKEGIRFGKEEFLSDLRQKAPEKAPAPELKPAKVEALQSAAPEIQSSERETRRKMSKIRKVIASRLVEAQQTTAMLTTFNEVDCSAIMHLREKYKELFQKKYGAKLGFMSFFVKAVIAGLKQVPDLNSYIDGDEIVHREYFDIGIAVGTERGLVVPVVRNCDRLSLAEIEKEIEVYATKAREGRLAVDDLQGGGFTITNGGVYGSLLSTPILNSPQSGILGMHKIEKRAVVVNDQIVIRPMMYLALSYDHRIVDGKEAVTFLVHVKNALEDPSRLLIEV
jgi:2-oxoglutarate dehydrogenase E2 component (dihydrolipoamide succinyltransferase)